jgi:ComF family protein
MQGMNRQRSLWTPAALASALSRVPPRIAALRTAGARLRQATAAFGQPLVDLLLPPRCAGCGAESEAFAGNILLCDSCRKQFTDSVHYRCLRCGAVAAGDCPACSKRRPKFARLVTLGPYVGALRTAVLRLKRPGHEAFATAMGQWLADRLEAALAEDDEPLALANSLVMPIPMHWMRRVAQQANSPDLLAAAFAARLSLPMQDSVLVRRKNTRKQGPMLRTERLQNVRGAFGLRPELQLTNAHVIVVDDVVTTGATCDEVARVLRRAGARRVTVATLARADSPR